uniref:Uncharacterized protein n=1 Tax=Arundo donax TaxID=35708 RepID=A0A0A9CL57_ARUDO
MKLIINCSGVLFSQRKWLSSCYLPTSRCPNPHLWMSLRHCLVYVVLKEVMCCH